MSKSKRSKRRQHEPKRHGPATRTGTRAAGPAAPAPPSRAVLAMLALAVAGVLLTGYLTAIKLAGTSALACGVGSDCDVVQSSRWSMLLGVPISAWGMASYAAIGVLVWRSRRLRRAWAQAWFVALAGFAISIYLTVVSVIEIEATCPYCLASLALLTALLAGLSLLRPTGSGEPRLRAWIPGAGIAVVAIVAGLHANYAGLFNAAAGPEKPELRALAEHLRERGARFYGAFWCVHCKEQKALFEASVDRLPYVECSPEGRNGPRAGACLAKDINAYPTWVIGERRYEQVLEPDELARLTDFQWPDPKLASPD